MEGSTSSKTIKLNGHINRKPVSMLLNTGTTYNFVDPRVVKGTGLKVTPEHSFRVTIAGGYKL